MPRDRQALPSRERHTKHAAGGGRSMMLPQAVMCGVWVNCVGCEWGMRLAGS